MTDFDNPEMIAALQADEAKLIAMGAYGTHQPESPMSAYQFQSWMEIQCLTSKNKVEAIEARDAAIRNAALEEAARKFEKNEFSKKFPSVSRILKMSARKIRSLKTPSKEEA